MKTTALFALLLAIAAGILFYKVEETPTQVAVQATPVASKAIPPPETISQTKQPTDTLLTGTLPITWKSETKPDSEKQ